MPHVRPRHPARTGLQGADSATPVTAADSTSVTRIRSIRTRCLFITRFTTTMRRTGTSGYRRRHIAPEWQAKIFGDLRGLQRADHGLFVTVCRRHLRGIAGSGRARGRPRGRTVPARVSGHRGDGSPGRYARLRSWDAVCRARGTARGTARRESQHDQCCQCDNPCHRCSQCAQCTPATAGPRIGSPVSSSL